MPAALDFQSGYQIEAGFDLNTGAQLWITNRTETTQTRLASFPPNSGVYTEVNLQTSVINGYSVTTGTQLWTTQLTGADGGSTNAYDNVGGYEAVPAKQEYLPMGIRRRHLGHKLADRKNHMVHKYRDIKRCRWI